jgi:hypothetical protein
MRFGDLAAKNETNAGTTRLCREERNEEVCGVGNSGTFVEYRDFQIGTVPRPSNLHPASRFMCRVGCVVDEVD